MCNCCNLCGHCDGWCLAIVIVFMLSLGAPCWRCYLESRKIWDISIWGMRCQSNQTVIKKSHFGTHLQQAVGPMALCQLHPLLLHPNRNHLLRPRPLRRSQSYRLRYLRYKRRPTKHRRFRHLFDLCDRMELFRMILLKGIASAFTVIILLFIEVVCIVVTFLIACIRVSWKIKE